MVWLVPTGSMCCHVLVTPLFSIVFFLCSNSPHSILPSISCTFLSLLSSQSGCYHLIVHTVNHLSSVIGIIPDGLQNLHLFLSPTFTPSSLVHACSIFSFSSQSLPSTLDCPLSPCWVILSDHHKCMLYATVLSLQNIPGCTSTLYYM